MRPLAACILAALTIGCGERSSPPAGDATSSGPTVSSDARASDEAYYNPVDKKTYVATNGWEKHYPAAPRTVEPGRKVKAELIRLLTPQADIEARISAAELSAFVLEAERLAEATLGRSGRKFKLLVQFTCNPAGHKVDLAHQGEATPELLQAYYDALTAADKPPIKDGEVSFQMELSVSP
jgi:hypothetical protein